MKDVIYQKLEKKLAEVTIVEPQNIGILTPLYKTLVPFLKFAPWRILIPLSFVFSLFGYFLIGQLIVFIVSLLQYGF